MVYRVFLYKTSAVSADALAIGGINSSITTGSREHWQRHEAADFLLPFDTDTVIRSIEAALTDIRTNVCKCKMETIFPPRPYRKVGYICVVTSYEKVHEVLPSLHAIASEHDLAMYDAERRKTFYRDLIDRPFISMRIRQQMLHHEIERMMKPLWKIRKIHAYEKDRRKQSDYVVILRKDPNKTFKNRVQAFYKCLSTALVDGEKLECKDRCYKILGDGYQITYTLEGYKKHAQHVGWENGRVELLNRMSTDEAFAWMKNCDDEETDDIFKRMNFIEMVRAYPNPADRFAASVNITKWQRRQTFDIRYSGIGCYGSEILFHIVPDNVYQDSANISVLKIEEESASFILPFVNDIYPDFYEHYYLEQNHLSMEAWERILKRLEEAKEMILHDTSCAELAPYVKNFNLFVLSKPGETEQRFWSDDRQFLYKHRYEVAALYDVFIKWSKAQFEHYWNTGDGRLFNIQGP